MAVFGLWEPAGDTPFVLVVDVRRGIEVVLEAPRPEERRGPPEAVDVAHLLGDLDVRVGRDLLLDQRHREDRGQVLRPDRLARGRAERRGGGGGGAVRGAGGPGGGGFPPRGRGPCPLSPPGPVLP